MTRITVLRKDNKIIGFKLEGHANYSTYGRDIVCAAISTLTINTINSIIELGHVEPTVYQYDGYIEYFVDTNPNIATNVLIKAALIGYKSISEQYPSNVLIEMR